MEEIKCPHCGSKYVNQESTQEAHKKSTTTYTCLSCKKTFQFTNSKGNDSDKWLMTFEFYNSYLQVYETSSGEFKFFLIGGSYAYEYKINENLFFVVHDRAILSSYDYSIISLENASQSIRYDIENLDMNEDLTRQALQNEAMRIVYGNKYGETTPSTTVDGDKSYAFYLGSDIHGIRSKELANDIQKWLSSNIPAFRASKDQASKAPQKGGCYIATCVYDSYDCPQVWTLRRFRDNTLGATWYGRLFIHTYYAISPSLVKWFGKTKWFKNLWKPMLDKMVRKLNSNGVDNTPYDDKPW